MQRSPQKTAFIKNNKSETHLSPPGFPDCTASLLSTTEGQEHLLQHNQRELSSSINHTRGILSSHIHSKYHRAHDETTKLGSKCHLLLYTAGKEATFPVHLFTALLTIYISMPESIKPISAFPTLLMMSAAGLWGHRRKNQRCWDGVFLTPQRQDGWQVPKGLISLTQMQKSLCSD